MKNLKSTKGFTLVELIVVIAILGILAAVAVPSYAGYISKAKDAKDVQVLSNINTAAQGIAAGKGGVVSSIVVTCNSGAINTVTAKYTISGTETTIADDDMKFLVTNGKAWSTITLEGTFKNGAHWTATGWETGTGT